MTTKADVNKAIEYVNYLREYGDANPRAFDEAILVIDFVLHEIKKEMEKKVPALLRKGD